MASSGPMASRGSVSTQSPDVFGGVPARHGPVGVSFPTRRLEYLIAWALAIGTAWTAAIVFPGEFSPWLAALFAAAIGAWSRSFPARHPAMMLGRAALLLCVALPLHTDPTMGGANGAYFYWPVAIAGAYALLLEWRLAVLLMTLAAAEYVLALWLAPPVGSLRPALSALGALLVWPPVAMMLAKSLHRADAEVESALTDAQTQLYNTAGLFEHGSALFLQCRREERPISLALLKCSDLVEAHAAIGRGATTQVLARAVRDLVAAASGEAIAARTNMREYALLLPDLSSPRAKVLLQSKLGSIPQIEARVNGRNVVIPLEVAVSVARDETPSLELLYERVLYKIRKRRLQGDVGGSTTTLNESSEEASTHTG